MASRSKSAGLHVDSSSSASTTTNPASGAQPRLSAVAFTPADACSAPSETDETAWGLKPFTTPALVELLYQKARPHLTRAELRGMATDGSEHVQGIARRAAVTLDGLAALVAYDGDNQQAEGAGCGYFQSSDDVPDLLFSLADQFRHIQAIAYAAAWAATDLAERGAE